MCYSANDLVLLPSGARALVRRCAHAEPDGPLMVELELCTARGQDALLTLRASLVRLITKDRPMPVPVRVNGTR